MIEPGEIRYATAADGVDIAYQTIGEGPPDVVFVSGFTSHLDLNWEFPHFEGLAQLAREARVVAFDKRGTGLSDRSLGFGSLSDRMDDIRAVMDAVGLDRAAVLGASEGGPLAALFAATYPHRVSGLVVYGSVVRPEIADDWPPGRTAEEAEKGWSLMADYWGSGRVLRVFFDEVPEDAQPRLAKFERSACTPQMVKEIMRRNFEIDIRPLVPAISVPTLVIHRRGDPIVPVAHGRYLGEHIPGAEYEELDGDCHLRWGRHGWDDVNEVIAPFLLGESVPLSSERVLATVLFTDIVESTEMAVALGDGAWAELLDRFEQAVADQVQRFGGRIVKTTGDGTLATFDSPSRALESVRAIHEKVPALGVAVRAGVHTGEVETRGEDVGGVAVHIASRVADLANGGEILTTRTVRDLAFGSSLEFEPRGPHALKGVPDEWELFAVVP